MVDACGSLEGDFIFLSPWIRRLPIMASELVLLEQWRERLKRQSEGGLTVEAFCQKEGVSTSMFYKWQRHLRESSSQPPSSDVAGTGQRTGKKRKRPI